MLSRRHFIFFVLLWPVQALGAEKPHPRTVLGIKNSQFTINDRPVFLLGISYYAGLGATKEQLRVDLDDIKARGFHWLRIWATWAAFGHDVSAVDADGRPRERFIKKLALVVSEADARGLIVDVALSRGNGVTGEARLQTVEAHRRGALVIAEALQFYRNWYLDLSNERNIKDKRFTSFADLKSIHDAVKKHTPHLLMTASHSGDMTPEDVRGYLQVVGVAFLAPHRPRDKEVPSLTAAKTKEVLGWAKDLGKEVPVHFQEPFRRGYGTFQPMAKDFLTDLQQARAGGAAGWCLHNGDERKAKDSRPRRSFDLRGEGRLLDRLDEVEREVIRGMIEPGGKRP